MKKIRNKGITLIALVITIIVLLILVGVSIATLTGESGILTKANTAKQETEIEEAKEQAKLDIADWIAERIQNDESTYLDDKIVKDILVGKDYVKDQPGDNSFRTKKGEHEIFYTDLYKRGKVKFTLKHDNPEYSGSFEVEYGTTWEEFMTEKFPNNWYAWGYGGWEEDGEMLEDVIIGCIEDSGDLHPPLALMKDSNKAIVKKQMIINSRNI